MHAELKGQIVDDRGNPVGGVRISANCDAFQAQSNGVTFSTRHASGSQAQANALGRFTISDVPRNLAYLLLDHPSAIPTEWGRQVPGGLESMLDASAGKLRIALGMRCHFRVELNEAGSIDSLGMLDQLGEPLELQQCIGRGRRSSRRMQIEEGSTSFLAVSDKARELVLYKGGEEVSRRAVNLKPGEEMVLRH
jgi:hypothetical protein